MKLAEHYRSVLLTHFSILVLTLAHSLNIPNGIGIAISVNPWYRLMDGELKLIFISSKDYLSPVVQAGE